MLTNYQVDGTLNFMPTESETTCRWCNEPLPDNHTGPCPKCGKIGKNVTIKLQPGFLKLTANKVRTITERRQEIVKENPKIKWITIAISVISLLVGVIFPPGGLIAGLIALFVTYYLGPFVIKEIIIERDKS
jgi:hypothetical protein